jgi:predicted PurR-regulated permease PerM
MNLTFLSTARFKRMLLWLAASVVVLSMLLAARPILLPFILGMVAAYLLLPLVRWLERRMPPPLRGHRAARSVAILLTYLLFLLLLAGVLAFVVPILTNQVGSLMERIPYLSTRLEKLLEDGLAWYRANIPETWKQDIETNLADIAQQGLNQIRNALMAMLRTVFSSLNFIISLVIIPFWLFYILKDETAVSKGLSKLLHPEIREDVQSLMGLIDDVLSAYVRGQLLLCLFVGVLATASLMFIGVPFAPVLGVVAGVFEVLPNIGPFLGAIPALLVALATEPVSAIWVAVAFLAIQVVENTVLVPRITGKSVQLQPALVMIVLVMGGYLAGFWGMLLAVPVTAAIRDVFLYLYLRLLDAPLSPSEAVTRIRSKVEVVLEA